MANKIATKSLLEKLFIGSLLVIFGGIVLHAPLTVGLSSLFPNFEILIKSWKEVLLGLALILSVIILTKRKQWGLVKHPLVLLIGAFALLHIALIGLYTTSPAAVLAGLFIDLRYLLFFVLVFTAIRLYPELRRIFIAVFVAGALIVGTFAILQVTVLPRDALTHIGYNETTIQPFLTVDQNLDYVRINSTLRGPNPLGAFAVIALTLLAAFWLKANHTKFKRPMFVVALLGIGSLVALWASYSRSALIGALIAIGLVVVVTKGHRYVKQLWIGAAILAVVLAGALVAFRQSEFVSNIILHENIREGNDINSNEGHIVSLSDGVDRMVHQPLGAGIGSTGSASLYTDEPVVIENQYLFIAHEAGWLGLGLFLVIFVRLLIELWRRRQDWLAVGVFASGIGLALIGLLLPVWADDTVGIISWGLAAVALGGAYGSIHKASKRTA